MYVIIWLCGISVYYQLNNVRHHYVTIRKEMAGSILSDSTNGVIRNKSAKRGKFSLQVDSQIEGVGADEEMEELQVEMFDLDYTDNMANSTEILNWFNAKHDFKPFAYNGKHPHLPPYKAPDSMCKVQPHIIIYLHSRPSNTRKRKVIRDTWANVTNFKNIIVERIFVIGKIAEVNAMGDVEDEMALQKDIIIGDFDDTFRNLSLKGLTLLDFVNKKCHGAKYILKADDDIFINTFMIVEKFIGTIWTKTKTVMCQVKEDNAADTTNKNGRWYIPAELLPGSSDKLPTFCSGYTVLFTADLVPLMLNKSLTSPLVPVDDAYVFGFLLSGIPGLNLVNTFQSFTLNQKIGVEEYTDDSKILEHVSVMAYEETEMLKLWKATLKRLTPLGKQILNFDKFKKTT